jgi:hypothetical protein
MDDSGADAPVPSEPVPTTRAPRGAWSRLSSTTWLAIFIAAVVIVATAIVLVAGNRPLANFPADSPEGAFQRYLVAWYDEDYETAYEYFSSPIKARMSYYDFTAYVYGSPQQSVTIDRTSGTGDRRHIFVTIEEFYGFGPGSSYSREESISMVLESGVWKIDEALSGVDPNYNVF